MKVQDLMTREVATARSSDTLGDATRLMETHDCGCVVVVGEHRQVEGILTDRDVCLAAMRVDRPLSEMKVDLAMNAEVHSCGPGDSIAAAERTMGLHQVRRLPVVDERGLLLGLLSLDDIAREARLERDLIAPPVPAEGVGDTLGQIGRPHLIHEREERRESLP